MALGRYVGRMFIKKFVVILLLVSSCLTYFTFFNSSAKQQVNVNLMWHEAALQCQSTFAPKSNGEAWFIEQLQFFLSDLEVKVEGKGWQKLALVDSPYQTTETVLLGGNCREQTKQQNVKDNGNWLIEFDNNIDVSTVRAVRFSLGVPFAYNHLNPVTQKSPLNIPSMFWVWQTGHKFLRAELASVDAKWLFHLGSTGCKASSVMRAPKQSCRYPNTFEFEIPVTKDVNNSLSLSFNLAKLLNGVELGQTSSCQSEQDNESCQQLFKNLSPVEKVNSPDAMSGVFNVIKVGSGKKGISVE